MSDVNNMIIAVKDMLLALKICFRERLKFHLFTKKHKVARLDLFRVYVGVLANFELLVLT